MKIELKKANKKNFNEIAKIYQTEFSKTPYNEKWTVKKATDKIKFFSKFYDLYSIFVNNKIVGFIVINPKFMCPGEVAFGEEIAIKEEFQRKGIGTFVFNKIFKIYKKKGFKNFMGIVNIKSKAYNLYKRLGIKPSKKDVLIERRLK